MTQYPSPPRLNVRHGKPSRPHHTKIRELHLRKLFADDPATRRANDRRGRGIYLDYSKNRITDETLRLLLQLAEESGLRERIDAMFRGEKINVTENRAVLHVALRAPEGAIDRRRRRECRAAGPCGARQDGRILRPRARRRVEGPHRQAHPQRRQYRHRRLRSRAGDGLRGARSTTASATMTFRFVSNVDGTDFAEAVRDLDPAETLFIVSSKTFTTLETMTNAHSRARLVAAGLGGDEQSVAKHFVAVSTNAQGSGEVRHRHRQHVRVLGLGRRPLFDGFGDRPVDDDRHRPGEFPRHARRLSPDGRAFPHRAVRAEPAGAHGPAGHLVQRLLRRADRRGAAVRAVPEALPGLSAAVDDGEQRQTRHAGRRTRSTTRPGRSTGASRAPTASTPSIS